MTPPPPPRQRRKDARPDEITAAALRLFAQRGYGQTTLADVARAAGISKGTIYLYFPTKEDLFRAVVRRELLPLMDTLDPLLAGDAIGCADLLRALAARLGQAMETDVGALPKLVLAEGGNFPEIARFYADEVIGRGRTQLAALLARGVAQGEFRPVEAETFLPLFIGPVVLMLLWPHSIGRHSTLRFDHRAVLATHIEFLLRGLRPEAAKSNDRPEAATDNDRPEAPKRNDRPEAATDEQPETL